MEVRKPKPVHSWGDLIGEIGVIVLGVLIALAAEQAVELVHWNHQLIETRKALREEINTGAGHAYSHRAIYDCNAKALRKLREELLKSGPAWKARPSAYEALLFTWDTSAWRTAQASGTLGHMTPTELNGYASAYQFPPLFEAQEAKDQDDAAQLDLLAYDLNLGDGMRGRMLEAVNRAERQNWLLALGTKQFLESAAAVGVTLSDTDKKKIDAQIGAPDTDCSVRAKAE
ncbi:MAG TPA: hypothetical protein VHW05_10420 [Phenylobacterium sp.]|jgi:hypothetical protein|nr:hypothetical protein [Phenylobacterium sp.]